MSGREPAGEQTPDDIRGLGPTLGSFAYSLRKNGLRIRHVSEVTEIADGDILHLPGKPVIIGMPGHSPGSVAVHVPLADAIFVGDALTTRHVLTGRSGPQPAPFTDDPATALSSLHSDTRHVAALL
ncbi:MBL fold metallo-hydrolase [Nonomuraea sp. NPDC048881]|uniref:MBL fold metallo-hydrolase n=1 Tax=Nonomuraea sp. NPDC048881 TaxID=3155030 RepID=UPI0033F15DC8